MTVKKFKRLSKSRSITIPRDMAAQLDIDAGTAVDLTTTQDGKLIISKHVDTCRFCGGADNVKQFRGMVICPVCATALYTEVCENG